MTCEALIKGGKKDSILEKEDTYPVMASIPCFAIQTWIYRTRSIPEVVA
jgi:hypothetical protein